MSIRKDIQKLLAEEIITKETADKLEAYYADQSEQSQSRLLVIFGVIGALLVGLGVVLIIAHNWDNLSKLIQTVIAFVPLILAQMLVVYTKWKLPDNRTWLEGSGVLLFFAVGACISMISQIYHISGNIGDYLMTWMLLALPIVYLLPSNMVGICYIMGVSYMGAEMGYFNSRLYASSLPYWLMLAALVPHYFILRVNRPSSNFLNFFNWLFPLSVIICLGIFADAEEELMVLAYMSLFGLFYAFGHTKNWRNRSFASNGFRVLGSAGIVTILLISSFREFWNEMNLGVKWFWSQETLVVGIITLLALAVVILVMRNRGIFQWKQWLFLSYIPIFFIGLNHSLIVVLVNLLILFFGIQTIAEGAKHAHLGHLNYGLVVIAALVGSRFFDADISFVLRGILFILVGIAFFIANYWLLKRRKHAQG